MILYVASKKVIIKLYHSYHPPVLKARHLDRYPYLRILAKLLPTVQWSVKNNDYN